jgi:hypothetical protein
MENLIITDLLPQPTTPALGPGLAMPTQPQQLPPQMFTTAAQLLDLTDSEDSYMPPLVIPNFTPAKSPALVHEVRSRCNITKGESEKLEYAG